jgi:hypothetical protein
MEPAEPAAPASSAAASSFDDLDFASLDSASQTAEPQAQAGETPDWLASMEPAQASTPAASTGAPSLGDLDFGSLDSTSHDAEVPPVTAPTAQEESPEEEPLPVLGEDAPDWLSAFDTGETEAEQPGEMQPGARHAMPAHFPEVDLSKVPEAESKEDEGSDFSFTKVSESDSDAGGFSFTKKQPAWMRKAPASKNDPRRGKKS